MKIRQSLPQHHVRVLVTLMDGSKKVESRSIVVFETTLEEVVSVVRDAISSRS